MYQLSNFKYIAFLCLFLYYGLSFGSSEKIENFLDKSQFNKLYNYYQGQSKSAEQLFDFDLFIDANLQQIEILQWFGANYLALEKLSELEDYLESRQLISEFYLLKLSRVRQAIFFNLSLYQNALLEGENELRLRLENRLRPETAQLDFLLLKASVFLNYSVLDSAALHLSIIEESIAFKNRHSDFYYSKFYMLKALQYSFDYPNKFIVVDSLLNKSKYFFKPISVLHSASFFSDEVRVLSALITGSANNSNLYERLIEKQQLANNIFDEVLGFYNKFSAQNLVFLALVNQHLGNLSLAENNFREALDRIQLTSSSVSSIDAHLATLIQKYYIFLGKEQTLNKQIENLENSVLLWQDFLSQLSINNHEGVRDKFGITPYGSASVAYLKRFKKSGNENDFIKAFDYYQQQAYRFLFEENFGTKEELKNDFKLKYYLGNNAEKVNFDFYLLGLNKKLIINDFSEKEVKLSTNYNQRNKNNLLETRELINSLTFNTQTDAASLIFISDVYFPNQLGVILFCGKQHFVEIIDMPDKLIEDSFLSSIYEVNFHDFKKKSYFLYKKILAWAEPYLDTNINSLTIYPSGELLHFPFELLISDTAGNSFSELNYLLKKYGINYKLSPKLGLAKKRSVENNKESARLLAIYPNRNDFFSLSKLPFSGDLFYNLSRDIEGEYLVDSLATINNINSKFKDFKVIQFLTHGSGSFVNSNENKIYLHNETLRLSDVYRLKTDKSPLVILAGCETGIGGNDFSEGGINFTRAFFFAGAESVLTSIWKLDDKVTSQILSFYYQKLLEGESSADALNLAKLNYLEQAKGIAAHPVYWAGLYHTGLNQKVNLNLKQSNLKFKWIVFGFVILFFMGKLFLKLKSM